MNKQELIEEISAQTGQSKTDTLRFVNALVTAIQNTLAQKDELAHVNISGLGNFSRQSRAERIGRNPKTGEAVTIPAKVVPVFKASKAFKEIVK